MTIKRAFRSPIIWALAAASVLLLVWAAWMYSGRAWLVAGAIAVLASLCVLLKVPILIAVLGTLDSTGALTAYLPSAYSPLMLLGVGVIAVRKVMTRDPTIRITPVIKWTILLMTWQVTTSLWSGTQDHVGFMGFYRILPAMLVFAGTVEKPRHYVYLALAAGVGMCLTAVLSVRSILDLFAQGSWESAFSYATEKVRFYGQWVDPNIMAQSLVPYIALAMAVAATRVKRWVRWLAGMSAAAGATAVMISMSRAGMLCLIITLLLITFAVKRRGWLLGAATAVLIVVVTLLPVDVIARMSTLAHGTSDPSVGARARLVRAGLDMMVDSFPYGLGMGAFMTYSMDYDPTLPWPTMPHNNYTEILAEQGLVGMLLFLGAFGSVLLGFRGYRWRMVADDLGQNMSVCLRTAVVVMLVSLLFLNMTHQASYWSLLTLASLHGTVFGPPGESARERDLAHRVVPA